MATNARMTLNLEPYFEALVNAGEDVDKIVEEELTKEKDGPVVMMWKYLRESSETWTGATGKTLFVEGPLRNGNFIYIEFGAHTEKDPAGWYKEYGTPQQAAEPFLRPTMNYYRTKRMKALMQMVLERHGLEKA
jgi:hypothetical protein